MAITDNFEAKRAKAKSLGYTDEQINTYLRSQGISVPTVPLTKKITNVAAKVTDSLGLRHASDVIADDINNIAHPKLMEAVNAPKRSALDNAAAGAELGLATAGGEFSGATAALGTSLAKQAVSHSADGIASILSKGVEHAASALETPIAKNVESVLKETPSTAFDHYVQLATKATENNKNVTPLEFVGRRAEHALETIQTQLKTIGQAKQELMGPGRVSVTPIDGTIVKTFGQKLASFRNSLTGTGGDTSLISSVQSELKKLGETPSAGQVDKFVDFVQDKIYTAGRDLTVPVTNKTTAALRSFTEGLNTGLKEQLPSKYKELNDAYSKLIGVRNELNTKLGKEGEKGGALMKRVFSPSDANTKELFAKVHELTGVDLVNEATLARYVMDVMGDARQKSMLEMLKIDGMSPKPGNVIGQAIHYITEHFNSPEEIIKRARTRTIGGSAQ
jgi:hypothetical protein